MKHQFPFLSVFCFFLLFCAACQSPPRLFDLQEKDSGMILDCDPGDLITVSLPANASTGYSWQMLAPADYLVLLPDEVSYQRKPGTEKMLGAP